MKLSVVQKLWLPLILSLFCLAGMSIYSSFQTRESQLNDRKADLQQATQIALGVVKTYGDQESAGTLTDAQAKARAVDALRSLRFGDNGYFVVVDSHVVVVMSPFHPELTGKDVSQYRDPNGVYVFQGVVDSVKATGSGFSTYAFPRPGLTEPVPKIAYSAHYQPWDWVIMTSLYVDDINAAFRSALYESLGLLIALACALSAVVLLLNRGITRSLGGEPAYAAEIANRIADFDLTATVEIAPDDRSSLLFSMKRMQERLTHTLDTIKASANSIAAATHQVAAGNTDLSQRTEEQAASLEETASSMEELTATVRQNADNAQQATTLATTASGIAQRGGEVVGRVVDTMHGISGSSAKVGEIISVIESIAFQTNILALNAAVEAARAGEQGRGFAVVASEVRTLAQRSASAAKEIKTLIGESVDRVQAGSKLVAEAGSTINEIVTSVRRVTDIIGEISSASHEQRTGIEQVHQAVTQMDEVTQQNAALVEEASAAAQSRRGRRVQDRGDGAHRVTRGCAADRTASAGTDRSHGPSCNVDQVKDDTRRERRQGHRGRAPYRCCGGLAGILSGVPYGLPPFVQRWSSRCIAAIGKGAVGLNNSLSCRAAHGSSSLTVAKSA
jgi:methyl-accepting chemotaxis protein